MSSALDISLDDLIKSNKKFSTVGNFRGRVRGGGGGPTRRFPTRSTNRSNPYSMGKTLHAPEGAWQHNMYSDQVGYPNLGSRNSAIETGTKLYISNLDYGVSNEDIKELFSEAGDLKRFSIHYDRSGRSKGTAEVVFSRRTDAQAAVKRYNNVQLDGKPMKIEIVGTNLGAPASIPQVTNGMFGNSNGFLRSEQGMGSAAGRPRGGGGRGWGRGRGRVRARGDSVSIEDLDADLEKYHSEAMQTN